MFTGLIEEIGKIVRIDRIPSGKRLTIQGPRVVSELAIGDSVAVSGVCLTVTQIAAPEFTVEAVGETQNKTSFKSVKRSQKVNLERATRAGDRLGGHIVQGHVNGIGQCKRLHKSGENWILDVSLPNDLVKYVVNEGSIALDGVSLTVAKIDTGVVTVSVIPHTFKNTVIRDYRPGHVINIETDVLAKYAENFLKSENKQQISIASLKSMGY